MRVLFSDPIHINEKNFQSLIDYLRDINAKITKPNNASSIGRFGDYSNFKSIIDIANDLESNLESINRNIEYRGVNLFDACQAELMSLCFSRAHWLEVELYGKSKDNMFQMLLQHDRRDLILNLASAKYWINFWQKILESKTFDTVLIFSGSLTYCTTLIEMMKSFPGKLYILESFYTGRHYYLEEKYSHIPNNTDARHRNVITARTPKNIHIDQKRLNSGLKDASITKNKNVQQPEKSKPISFKNKNKVILIAGQVANDFSLLKTGETGINSIHFYIKIISELLSKTNVNIIFKSHPWENKKSNIKEPLTKTLIESKFSNNERLNIIENYNIYDIFDQVDYLTTLNSQIGIEAAIAGIKPYQFGNAFYGKNGFTYDLHVDQIEAIISDINLGKSGHLNSDEYIKLREYLMHMLIDHLIPEESMRGKNKLSQIFKIKPAIVTKASTTENTNKLENKSTITTKAEPDSTFEKKLLKLKNNPKLFFIDSRYRVLNFIGKVLK